MVRELLGVSETRGNSMKCFHHNDPDGILAAFWVYYFMGPDTDFIPMWYGKEFPFSEVKPKERVFIVDYSIEPEEMKKLLSITREVYWIDHHATAIDKYVGFPYEIKGLRDVDYAGCALTYYFLSAKAQCDSRVTWVDFIGKEPKFCRLIASMDVRRFRSVEEKVLAQDFLKGLYLGDVSTDSNVWRDLVCDKVSVSDIADKGRIIREYDDSRNKNRCSSLGFECEFEGYKCFAVNDSVYTDYFDSVEKEKYDIFIGFVFNGRTWKYSLRSGFNSHNKDIDVSKIALKYGGGGHKYASGMILDSLIIKSSEEGTERLSVF